jgi:hypothetical protein
MNARLVSLSAIVALVSMAGTATAQYGYSIAGGLSNFDVTNHTDHECDEFEIEIEDCRPQDIYHTYRNPNYGPPTITASGTATIIDYRHPLHTTSVNTIEHFGVSLRQLTPQNVIRVRWMRNGQPATVNGVVPNPGGGSSPAAQPIMPSISAAMGVGPGGEGVSLTIRNNDPLQSIWIKRRARVSMGTVSLEALMTNDPVVTTTIAIDAAPVRLAPFQTLTALSDLVEIEDNQSAVFAAEYYQDIFGGGPFGGQTHTRGPLMGNVMTASIASPESGCDVSQPIIQEQPVGTEAGEGSTVNLRVRADGNDMDLTYQWMREGVPLVESAMFHAVDTDELSIEEVTSASEGSYAVRISNACGTVLSDAALVFVVGHNEPPPRPPLCGTADFNGDGDIGTDQDIEAFFRCLAGDCCTGCFSGGSDFNGDGDSGTDADIEAFFRVLAGGNC